MSLSSDRPGGATRLDVAAARRHGAALRGLARALGFEPPRVEALLQFPGVLVQAEGAAAGRAALGLVRRALVLAAERVLTMRRREGRALGKDLAGRFAALERGAAWIVEAWPAMRERQRERSLPRVKELLERVGEGRAASLAKEIVAAAERGDVTEELVRLRSHLAQCESVLGGAAPAGRKLDFLIQEINRELHTIAAKSDGAAEIQRVVEMKEEAERIREQVQNLE